MVGKPPEPSGRVSVPFTPSFGVEGLPRVVNPLWGKIFTFVLGCATVRRRARHQWSGPRLIVVGAGVPDRREGPDPPRRRRTTLGVPSSQGITILSSRRRLGWETSTETHTHVHTTHSYTHVNTLTHPHVRTLTCVRTRRVIVCRVLVTPRGVPAHNRPTRQGRGHCVVRDEMRNMRIIK